MRKITVALLIMSLASCGPKIYPSTGKYQKPPIIYFSDKSFDQVWDNVIDLFAQKGIPIAVIDRSSGLIVSTVTDCTWSTEDDNGELYQKYAWVVINRYFLNGRKSLQSPSFVSGRWNVRIKTVNGRTSINVNLTDLMGFDTLVDKLGSRDVPNKVYGPRTTGNFEKLISNIIK